MDTLLWDVDTQKDFIEEDGRLYVDGAEKIRDNLERITNHARENDMKVWGSLDYHNEDDPEISDDPDFEETFPPHCLQETEGWEKIPETLPDDPLWIDSDPLTNEQLHEKIDDHPTDNFFRKQRFNVFSNENLDPALDYVDPFQVVVYGVTLEVCVKSSVRGFLDRGFHVTVIEDATRALDENKRDNLLFNWKNLGAQVIGTEEALSGYIL